MSKKDDRNDWLNEHDAIESDVMVDAEGREYIVMVEEQGTEGDDYQVEENIIHLPEEISN